TGAVSHDVSRCHRMLRAAEEAASFTHPRVASLLEIGEDAGRDDLYVVYDGGPGTTLKATLAQRHFSVSRSLSLAIELAETVADIHDAGLIHGGLNLDAVMLGPTGAPTLLYFGVGPEMCVASADAVYYTAPESRAEGVIDERADIFSVGAILARIL